MRCVLCLLSAITLVPAAADVVHTIDPGAARSQAVVVPGELPLLHTAQILPADPQAAADVQVRQAFDALAKMLREHGSSLERVVKVNAVLGQAATAELLEREMAHVFAGRPRPALCVVVGRFPAAVGLDAVATLPEDPNLQKVRLMKSAGILPSGARVWVSGQAESGGGDLAKATRLTMESLRRTLTYLRLKDDAIVQLKAFVHPIDRLDVARREMEAYFGKGPVPPIVFVEWQSPNSIEIELIAHAGRERGGWPVEYLAPPELKPSPVYSRVARVNFGPLIYVSGLHPARPGQPAEEIVDVFDRLGTVLQKAGSDLRNLVKATYYVTDDETVKQMREIRPRYYDPQRPPAASLAKTAGTGRAGRHMTLDMIAVPAVDRELNASGPPTSGHELSTADADAGWISLFDGKTPFGWKDARVEAGCLVAGTSTCAFGPCEVRLRAAKPGKIRWGTGHVDPSGGSSAAPQSPAPFELQPGIAVTSLQVRPTGLNSLFNGKDLTGWKRIDHAKLPESSRPIWKVENGILRAIGGPGALEYQAELLGDFVLQVKARTRLRHSNGGLFLRAIPGDFMNGYEAQIYTRCIAGDVTRPAVWATGAIDDRQNARMLVNRDGVPFTMTMIAQGPHLATWVNGYQTVDWTDTRPSHANPRQGLRLEPGALQLQAHDAATDEEFHWIRAQKW